MRISNSGLKEFLEEQYQLFNNNVFIESDPVQVPHLFTKKEDIEISAFLSALIAWGQRKTIISNAKKLMFLMNNSPYDFLMNYHEKDLKRFNGFVHRTFNSGDCLGILTGLRNIYENYGGLENVFTQQWNLTGKLENGIISLREKIFETDHEKRTEKHISDITKNSSAKRINMFLRWMVRTDGIVDFGIWKEIPASTLFIPLDVHTGNVARKLGLLSHKQNDWKSVLELTGVLKKFDPDDPIKYDFALFGLGVNKKLDF